MNLPQWMYRQIITDESVKAVWCFCGKPAVSYCNGLQFVCDGGGHFGTPMVMLKPRREQRFLVEQCRKAREALRAEEARKETLRIKRKRTRQIRPEEQSQ